MRNAHWISALSAIAALTLAGCGDDGEPAARTMPSTAPPAVKEQRVGGAPVAVAVDERGVWVADNAGARAVRLDPRSARRVGPVARVGQGPAAIAAGEGAVWAAAADGTVTRIDPEAAERSAPVARVDDPTGIAAGEGAVWVASGAGGTVTRIEPDTGERVGAPIEVGSRPTDLAVGAGSVWVANSADGTVSRIDAATGEPSEPIPVAGEQVLALAYGEDAVWVAESDRLAETIELVRIDPETATVDGEAAEIEGAGNPVRLSAGHGLVWATLVGGVRPPAEPSSPAVARIDPETLEPLGEPVRVGERPAGIAMGEDAVWVANSGDGTVSRLRPKG